MLSLMRTLDSRDQILKNYKISHVGNWAIDENQCVV